MNFKYKTSTLALTIAGFLAVEAHLSVAQAQIDEIIVTARKREQSLQTVPIAITAISGANLASAGIQGTDELGQMVPNLTITVTNVGLRLGLRGQTINEGLIHEDPSVNLNVDGVYIARTHGAVIPFLDIEQVEVLRGPQGTLFGRNTTGGAVNVTSKKPEYEWGGEVGGRLGNFERGDVWAMVNVPVIEDRIAVRAAGTLLNAGGYKDGANALGQNPFDDDQKVFFGSALFEPLDNLDIIIRGDWSRKANHYGNESTRLVNTDPVGTGGGAGLWAAQNAVVLGLTSAEVYDLYGTNFGITGGELPHPAPHNAANADEARSAGVSATIVWDANDLISVKSVIAKRWLARSTTFDLDGTPNRMLHTNQVLDHAQTTAEVQFYGDFDLFGRNMDWIGGAFYFEEEALQGSFTDVLGGLNPVTPQIIRGNGINDSIAGFAELDYEILEDFRITMGGRYTVDTKYADNSNSNGFFPTAAAAAAFAGPNTVFQHPQEYLDLLNSFDHLTPLDVVGTSTANTWTNCRVSLFVLPDPSVCFVANEETFSNFSWNFGWDWTAWDDGANSALVYANYKRSFRSGGQNFRGTLPDNSFDPEFVRQIAAGMKLDLLDGNMRFNVEGFHQKVSDKQVVTVIAGPTGLVTLISNAAQANVKGVEFEVDWTPLPDTLEGLFLHGGLGWTDPIYKSFPDTQPADSSLPFDPVTNPLVAIDRSDEPFTRISNLSANAAIVYNHAVWDSCDGNLMTRLDWSYKQDAALTRVARGLESIPGSLPLAELGTGDYFLVNARSALSLWNGGIEVGVYCKNCTDTQYQYNALDLRDSLGYAVASPSIPRTFGGDLTYRWGVGK